MRLCYYNWKDIKARLKFAINYFVRDNIQL